MSTMSTPTFAADLHILDQDWDGSEQVNKLYPGDGVRILKIIYIEDKESCPKNPWIFTRDGHKRRNLESASTSFLHCISNFS